MIPDDACFCPHGRPLGYSTGWIEEKSTPIDAATLAAHLKRLRKILSPPTIEKLGGGRLATTITTVDLAEARKELDSVIAVLEAVEQA